MVAPPSSPLAVARDAWGDMLPDWVERLAQECSATSQTKAARKLGRSPALVSYVLRNKYEGDMLAVEELVRGVLMGATIDCPALGDLPTSDCLMWRQRAKAFSGHNALRVQMYRACHRCPVKIGEDQK